MAFMRCSFFSEIIGYQTNINIIIPFEKCSTGGAGRYPVLYLLHGGGGNQDDWVRYTSIERYAEKYDIAVVMPDVSGNSFYADMAHGYRYFEYLTEELPEIMEGYFPIGGCRERRFVAGLSMGGYGAFKLGLRCPETFSCAASLSGALDFGTFYNRTKPGFAELIAGDHDTEFVGSDNDLFAVAERLIKSGRPLPKLWQWCGTEDFLIGDNRRMRDHLLNLGYDLTYQESEGNHNWAFWDKWIQAILEWLPIKK